MALGTMEHHAVAPDQVVEGEGSGALLPAFLQPALLGDSARPRGTSGSEAPSAVSTLPGSRVIAIQAASKGFRFSASAKFLPLQRRSRDGPIHEGTIDGVGVPHPRTHFDIF